MAPATVLIFDFDGVLIDSVDETAVTGFNTVNGRSVIALTDLPPDYLALFRLNRCRARSAGEIVTLSRWCLEQRENRQDLLSQAEFDALLPDPSRLKAEAADFFRVRSALAETNFIDWVGLNKPYEPVWSWLKNEYQAPVLILTHKNARATLEICRYFGLPLPLENIYGGDDGASKTVKMQRIIARHGSRMQYAFIDDAVKNLRELRAGFGAERLRLLFAQWGYCTPEDAELAKRSGFEVVNLGQAPAVLAA